MFITQVKIKLMNQDNSDSLIAFASIALDNIIVIDDLRVIEGEKGIFVSMPSRKLMARCHRCKTKNHLRANFCNECGVKLQCPNLKLDPAGRKILYADIVRNIHQAGRTMITRAVLNAYYAEQDRAKMPDYICNYDHHESDEVA